MSIILSDESIEVESIEHEKKGNMIVCVKPLHTEYNRALWFVEFIEMYRLLGADHFQFYDHTAGPEVKKILRYYEEKGLVTLLSWNLPIHHLQVMFYYHYFGFCLNKFIIKIYFY